MENLVVAPRLLLFKDLIVYIGKANNPGKKGKAHHSPPLYSVLHEQILCHGCRDLGHVMSVVVLTHTLLAVPQNCQAEELASAPPFFSKTSREPILRVFVLGGERE